MMELDILLVDDEAIIHESIGRYLGKCGHRVTAAYDGDEGLDKVREGDYQLALIDIRMPRRDGLAFLEAARSLAPDLACVIITAHADLDDAVTALRQGAIDFLRKPIELIELDAVLERVTHMLALQGENRHLKGVIRSIQSDAAAVGGGGFSGPSRAAAAVREQIEQAAAAGFETILVTGETGVGKEVVAREIHHLSAGDDCPFIAVNCPAIPVSLLESELFGHVKGTFTGAESSREGSFELADGGTLLLDEVADLPLQAQAAILRVVETRRVRRVGGKTEIPVNIRLIAATNADLAIRVRDGRFRDDLYYRLAVFMVHVPPLRDRPEDIIPLAEQFLAAFAGGRGLAIGGFSDDAKAKLAAYAYPGNVRELRNIVERAAVCCRRGMVDGNQLALPDHGGTHQARDRSAGDPPARVASAVTDSLTVDQIQERGRIIEALTQARWNRRQASGLLGMSYSTLREKIARYALR